VTIAALLALLALLATAETVGNVWAAWTATTTSTADRVTATADWSPPTASSSLIAKTEGGTPGFIRRGGTYNVYGNISDTGHPASGIASVVGNPSTITTGQSAAALASGSFTIGGTNYSHRTGNLTANATLAEGSYTYSLTSTDAAANSRTQTGYTVTVDNTVPTAADIQTTNRGGNIAGRPDIGDTVILTFSEPIDPNSVLAGWTGASTNVVVRIDNNTPTNDRLAIRNAANTAQLPLGTVNLGRTDYVFATTTFGASGTASTITQSDNAITITLGTASSGPTTAGFTGSVIWSPSATATDRAGNAQSTATRTETGTADKDF
jgi:hypothetical protein